MAVQADTTNNEIWRAIPGWEGLYEASNFGHIRSLGCTRLRIWRGQRQLIAYRPRVLKPFSCGHGYQAVSLYGDDRTQKISVHRIVCITFHGPQPEGCEVAHGNGVRTDNAESNLRWATRLENHADKIGHGTLMTRGSGHPNAKLTERQVCEAKSQRSAGVMVKDLASSYGITPNSMARILRRT